MAVNGSPGARRDGIGAAPYVDALVSESSPVVRSPADVLGPDGRNRGLSLIGCADRCPGGRGAPRRRHAPR